MKKIILMCLFGLMFSQTELTTRVFSVYVDNTNDYDIYIPISNLIGDDLAYGTIHFLGFDSSGQMDLSNRVSIAIVDLDNLATNQNEYCGGYLRYNNYDDRFWIDGENFSHFRDTCNDIYFKKEDGKFIGEFMFAITAEFPIEDTGYIEEGFDFCLVSGNNLVAFPCDNPVSVETALPELAQAEISQIIGAGVAATNLNGQFIGSLSNFSPGAGYWFKSSSSMCFNYACAE